MPPEFLPEALFWLAVVLCLALWLEVFARKRRERRERHERRALKRAAERWR